jgi:hypothetical protein
MSTVAKRLSEDAALAEPLLENGERLSQKEFHRRYKAYPEDKKFELIGGMVFMSSALRRRHARYDEELSFAFGLYRRGTPGVELLPNATTILGEASEPQPDLTLRILAEYGGRSRENEDDYIQGPPELLAEIAYSTRSIDLTLKRLDYQRARVTEYLVLCVEDQRLHWFHFKSGRRIYPDAEGIFRSRVLPGLWIDSAALLVCNSARVVEAVQQGLASPQHAAFVKGLEAKRRRRR